MASDTQLPRVLVVKLSSLGDLFHALPAVHCIKQGLRAEIEWVTQREYADLVRRFSDVSRVIEFPRKGFGRKAPGFFLELWRRKYDYVIDFQGLLKSAFVSRFARGMRRIGPSFHREGSRLLYTSVAGAADRNRHAVDQNMDAVRHLGIDVLKPAFPLNFPAIKILRPSPRIAIFPVARWKTKCWPAECYVSAAKALRNRVGASIFLLGGKEDVEVCKWVEKEVGDPVDNVAGGTSLVELGSVLSGMDLVITNDSGPMHMAAAIGVPVLAVFGPTDPRRTGPYGDQHRVLAGSRSCRPCLKRRCSLDALACMREVSPAMVVTAALEMLQAGHA